MQDDGPPVSSTAPAPFSRPTLGEQLRAGPVTVGLIAVDVAVFLLAERAGSTTQTDTLIRFGAVWRDLVWRGELWRLFTSMFLHIGVLHLVWNSWFGFQWCVQLERRMGHLLFLLLYLGSGVFGASLSVIGHDAVAAGASGAIFGVIGAGVFDWWQRAGSLKALLEAPRVRQQLLWIGGWFVLGAFAHFDNYAHLGGLLFGLLFSWALAATARARTRRVAS